MSQRGDIRAAVRAALNAAGKPAGLTVHPRRVRPFRAEELPVVEVSSVRDLHDGENDDSSGISREFRLALTFVVAGSSADPEADLEPLIEWGLGQIQQDPTLGGLAIALEERDTEWFADESEHLFAAARVEFDITYTTLPTEV